MADEAHGPTRVGGSPECTLCPVCVLLQAMTASRPEATEHLIAAGRELTLALKAALSDHADESGRAEERLRRIKIN